MHRAPSELPPLAEPKSAGFNPRMLSRLVLGLLSALLVACSSCSSGRAASPDRKLSAPRIAASGASAVPLAGQRVVTFEGMCDASGAVPIDAHWFAVADDESNVLRIYDADRGGPPIDSVDVTAELHLKKKKNPEADLEAATRLGDHALWISSHARSKKGKSQPDRLRFFATNVPSRKADIRIEGQAYTGLLQDLLRDPRLASFKLAEAAALPPQAEGGLNLEGMTAMPSGGVLLGFRNPVPEGKALLVALENPLAMMRGEPARLGVPRLVDLGGLGVRGLSYWRGRYLIAAGHYEQGAVSRLFSWKGDASPPRSLPTPSLEDFNPEAFFTPEERDEFMLLSDDGARTVAGERCKDLEDPSRMRFRGLWLR